MEVEDLVASGGPGDKELGSVMKVHSEMEKTEFYVTTRVVDEGEEGAAAGGGRAASIEIVLQFDANSKPLLMVELAAKAASVCVVRETKGIQNAFVIELKGKGAGGGKQLAVQTEGCNLREAWKLADFVQAEVIQANDVGAILQNYGVEAARASIVREVKNVFGVYGIKVDPRHLGLVADYMTFEGGYTALNRIGIESSPSAFHKMSFETSSNFLTDAALNGELDPLVSPSSRIVMGQIVQSGTGAFDLLVSEEEQKPPSSGRKVRFS